jgi:protein subunit release factor A
MRILIEIRPGEGGEDARLLMQDQAAIYVRYAEKHGMTVNIEEQGHL